MTNFMDELKKTVGVINRGLDSNDADYQEKEKQNKLQQERSEAHKKLVEKSNEQVKRSNTQVENKETLNTVSQKNKPAKAITVNLSSTVKVLAPKEKEDSYLVINELKNRQTVIVKLGGLDAETRKSILENIYGACYFADYSIERVDSQMILIDPKYQEKMA